MEKQLKIEVAHNRPGIFELWKLNRKGFYNFVAYLEKEELSKINKQFKGYRIVDKQNCLAQNLR